MSSTDGLTLTLRGGAAALLAVVVNSVLVAAAQATGIAPDLRALSYPPVVFLTVVGVAGATVVYWLLARRGGAVDRTFVRVAVVVLVLSLVPDVALLFADETATIPGVLVLMVMHVVAAAASIRFLTQTHLASEDPTGPTAGEL